MYEYLFHPTVIALCVHVYIHGYICVRVRVHMHVCAYV